MRFVVLLLVFLVTWMGSLNLSIALVFTAGAALILFSES